MESENLIEKDSVEEEVDDLPDENASLVNGSIFDDIKTSFCEARIAAPLIVLLAIFLGYHLTVAPYKTHTIDRFTPDVLSDMVC